MVSGGMKLIKYLIFFFNFIFFVSGIVLIVVGSLVLTQVKDYAKLIDDSFSTPPIIFITVGVLIALIAFFGCCGAIKENHCMTMTFAVLLTLVLIIELAAGILAYTKRDSLENALEKNIMKAIKNYDNEKFKDFSSAIDDFQKNFDCCGYNGPMDYQNATMPLPSTCCTEKDGHREKECVKDASRIENTGCKENVSKFFKDNVYVIGGIGIALAVIQVLGIIFACCLAKTIKNEGSFA